MSTPALAQEQFPNVEDAVAALVGAARSVDVRGLVSTLGTWPPNCVGSHKIPEVPQVHLLLTGRCEHDAMNEDEESGFRA